MFWPAYSSTLNSYFLLSDYFIETQSASDTAAAEWSRTIFVSTKTLLKSAASLSKIIIINTKLFRESGNTKEAEEGGIELLRQGRVSLREVYECHT